jgi:hypothetical protein
MNDKEYFTLDLQNQISKMSESEMNESLLALESSEYWIPILRYLQKRMMIVQNSLMTTDPILKATEMCRNQGILMGLSDLQNAVILLKEKDEKNNPSKK